MIDGFRHVRALHAILFMDERAPVPAKSPASLQYRSDDYDRRRGGSRWRTSSDAHAVGSSTRVVEKIVEGIPGDIQRPRRDGCNQANVSVVSQFEI